MKKAISNIVLASVSALTLAACMSVGPDYKAPATESYTAHAIEIDDGAVPVATEPAATWWTTLDDPVLNTLVERAFEGNRDLRVAAARVEASRALLSLERVNQRPTGEVTAGYSRNRYDDVTSRGLDLPDTNLYAAGLSAGWELDFFGRVRRLTEAAAAEASAATYLRRDAEALVAAETVSAYIDYRSALTRLHVAERNLEVQNETRSLTETRLEEGVGSRLDVARAQAQAKTTEALIPPLQAARVAAENRLATLIGAPVSDVRTLLAEGGRLPTPPATLAIGDTASLLKRRADVRAAERSLAAATARIGVAKADYFPRISLTGTVSTTATAFSNVGEGGSFAFAAGPSLTWSGFDIPRVRASIKVADANTDAAFATYEKTVLEALEETQTSLSAYGRERVRFEALRDAAARAREAASIARTRYDAGADDFIDVLDAESRQLAAEASLAESQAAMAARYVGVYLALGAGWQTMDEGDGRQG